MPHKSEIIHGINSTHKIKYYQSALTQRKCTVTCIAAVAIQQYNTMPHREQRRDKKLHLIYSAVWNNIHKVIVASIHIRDCMKTTGVEEELNLKVDFKQRKVRPLLGN